MRHASTSFAAVALLLAVASAGCDRFARHSEPTRLHYVVTVPRDPGQGAQVEVLVHGPAPRALRMLLPPRGGKREVKTLRPHRDSASEPARIISYSVAAPSVPLGGRGFACYRGFELFAQPPGKLLEPEDSVFVEFRLPPDAALVAPLAALIQNSEPQWDAPLLLAGPEFKTLMGSYLAVGDYRTRILPAVPGTTPAVVWGSRGAGRASEGELIAALEKLLAAHTEIFGPDRPQVPYAVVVDFPYIGHGFAGNATGRSINLRLSREMRFEDSPGLVRLLSHELSHFWIGGAFKFTKPEDHWFAEGAADYYGLRARVDAGFTTLAQASDELAEDWFELEGSSWMERPIEGLGREFRHSTEAFSASYARGSLSTWALDWRCKLSGRPPLVEAIRAATPTSDHPPVREIAKRHLGEVAARDVDDLLGAHPREGFAHLFAELGLAFQPVPTEEMTLGLERFEPGTTRLVAVASGSAARSAGVRPGDSIRAIDGLPIDDTVELGHAIQRSYGRSEYKLEGIEVTYERAGSLDRVVLFARPYVRPAFHDSTGQRAEAMLP